MTTQALDTHETARPAETPDLGDPVKTLRLELGSYLRQVLGKRQITATRLSERTGLTKNRLSLILNGSCVITETELNQITEAIPNLTEEEQTEIQQLGSRAARSRWSVAAIRIKDGAARILPAIGPARKPLSEEVAEIKQMIAELREAMEQLLEKI